MNTFIIADVCKGFGQARRKALKSVNRRCVHTNNNVLQNEKDWSQCLYSFVLLYDTAQLLKCAHHFDTI